MRRLAPEPPPTRGNTRVASRAGLVARDISIARNQVDPEAAWPLKLAAGAPVAPFRAVKQTLSELKTREPPQSSVHVGPFTAGLTVVSHPEIKRIGDVAPLVELGSQQIAELSRLDLEFFTPYGEPKGPLGTSYLSRTPLQFRALPDRELGLVVPANSTSVVADGELVASTATFSEDQVESGVVLELSRSIVLVLHRLSLLAPRADDFDIKGESAAARHLRDEIRRVADVDVPVLLRGETGSGKELVAAAICKQSRRSDAPYVCVNMAALPETLAASMLFGHRRGAFTSAGHHTGYFEQADGGTLFLDEIGDTPKAVQPLLLRATQGEIQVLGESSPQKVDVRLIAATDLDLEGAAAAGGFRAQLQERLAGYEIIVPPLRARKDDIGRLFIRFLREELDGLGRSHLLDPTPEGQKPWLKASFMGKLARYHWPRNVRQLRNVARQLAIANRSGDDFRVDARIQQLFDTLSSATTEAPESNPPAGKQEKSALDMTDEELREALREHRFNITTTAESLGVSRTWLNTRLDATGALKKARDLTRPEVERALAECSFNVKEAAQQLEVSLHGLKQRLTALGIDPKSVRR